MIPTSSDHQPYAWLPTGMSVVTELTDADALNLAASISRQVYGEDYDIGDQSTVVADAPTSILGIIEGS